MQIISSEHVHISSIVAALKLGSTLVYPTETSYGLGCDATQETAIEQIFAIKKRQQEKSVLVIFPNIAMAKEYVEWNPTIDTIAAKYWPGPVTVVSRVLSRDSLPLGVVSAMGTIAFRVSSHPLVQEISAALQKPLVSTSANISAQASPYDIDSVLGMFAKELDQPDIIIDGGNLPHRAPSTIVAVHSDERIEILRQGDIVVEV